MNARKIFLELPTLVDVPFPKDSKLTVCGDTHGQYYDLLNIFELNGFPSETNPYVFFISFIFFFYFFFFFFWKNQLEKNKIINKMNLDF